MSHTCQQCNTPLDHVALNPFCPQCGTCWQGAIVDSETREISIPFFAATEARTEIPETIETTQCPVHLSVRNHSVHPDDSQIAVEVRVRNQTSSPLKGIIWIADPSGLEGTPEPLDLPGSTSRQIVPEIRLDSSRMRIIRLRTRLVPETVGFWQASLIVQRAQDGRICIHVDNSQNVTGGEKSDNAALGGATTINASITQPQIEWQDAELTLRGPLELSDPNDHAAPQLDCRCRYAVDEQTEVRIPLESSTARLTLSEMTGSPAPRLFQLIAGRTILFGRGSQISKVQIGSASPSDVVLRTLRKQESDNYISRSHFEIELREHDYCVTCLSSGKCGVGARSIEKGKRLSLASDVVICPGIASASAPDRSLQLRTRVAWCAPRTERFRWLIRDFHLQDELDERPSSIVLNLQRNDALQNLEEYVLFHQTVSVGSDQQCGWRIQNTSLQPTHAFISWFAGSFWIEPAARDCDVRIDGNIIRPGSVRRLHPGARLELGQGTLSVAPNFRQHLVNCSCCEGHGYARGCRCLHCVAEENLQRKKKGLPPLPG